MHDPSHALDVSTTTLTTTSRLLIRAMFVFNIYFLSFSINDRKGILNILIHKQNFDFFHSNTKIM